MKLLIYSHYFAPSIGGVETIVESLARGLAERRAPFLVLRRRKVASAYGFSQSLPAGV